MQLEHSFTVPVGVDEAWRALLDIERVAHCMPGAALDSVEGDDFTGTVKVKLGPIGLTYRGKASFVEKDEAAHRATIDAQGKDARGNGTASAKVTATLHAEGAEATMVKVLTDLAITGKPAQFGRGVMVDVGNKLIGQFADCLAGQLAGVPAEAPAAGATTSAAASGAARHPADGAAPPAAGSTPSAAGQPAGPGTGSQLGATAPAPEVEPIDLMASAGPAVAKRLAPVAAGVAGLVVLIILRRRRRRHR